MVRILTAFFIINTSRMIYNNIYGSVKPIYIKKSK